MKKALKIFLISALVVIFISMDMPGFQYATEIATEFPDTDETVATEPQSSPADEEDTLFFESPENTFDNLLGTAQHEATMKNMFTSSDVVRISGNNRYITSVINAFCFTSDTKLDSIIIANGNNFPDALTGSFLSIRKKSPILLIGNNNECLEDICSFLADNLSENATVYILGGNASVSQKAENSIKSIKGHSLTVKRISGSDRYETNIKILNEGAVNPQDPIVVCDGSNFADAISASALGCPILLADKTKTALSESQKTYIKSGTKVIIAGGTGAVTAETENAIREITGVDPVRLSGKNRYETSLKVAQWAKENKLISSDDIVVTTGEKFPDGLSCSLSAYCMSAPIIVISDNNTDYAGAYTGQIKLNNVLVLGGLASVSNDAVCEIINK